MGGGVSQFGGNDSEEEELIESTSTTNLKKNKYININKIKSFGSLDKLCKSGYFQKESNLDEYYQILKYVILNNSIDCLEILIIAGNLRKIFPLHLASALGKLEACELLTSAGFDFGIADDKGFTCLHHCANNNSIESSLCVTHFLLQNGRNGGRKLLSTRDFNGNTALHKAVENMNEPVVKSLMIYILERSVSEKIFNIPNGSGQTPKDIAITKNNPLILKLLNSDKYSIEDYNKPPPKIKAAAEKKVSEERIMQIWEQFFENAFKSMDDENEMIDGLEVNENGMIAAANNLLCDEGIHLRGKAGGSNKKIYNSDNSNSIVKSTQSANKTIIPSVNILNWLDLLVCYSHGDGSEFDCGYYIINRSNGSTYWLSNYLENEMNSNLIKISDFPSTINIAIVNGWFHYFDNNINQCYWMHAFSESFQYSIPIGNDPVAQQIGLFSMSEGDKIWLECDQSVTLSWIVVIMSNKDKIILNSKLTNTNKLEDKWSDWDDISNIQTNDQLNGYGYYYLNLITSQTSWIQPQNWSDVIVNWGDWLFCCSEESNWFPFWFHEPSGESIWAEEI